MSAAALRVASDRSTRVLLCEYPDTSTFHLISNYTLCIKIEIGLRQAHVFVCPSCRRHCTDGKSSRRSAIIYMFGSDTVHMCVRIESTAESSIGIVKRNTTQPPLRVLSYPADARLYVPTFYSIELFERQYVERAMGDCREFDGIPE